MGHAIETPQVRDGCKNPSYKPSPHRLQGSDIFQLSPFPPPTSSSFFPFHNRTDLRSALDKKGICGEIARIQNCVPPAPPKTPIPFFCFFPAIYPALFHFDDELTIRWSAGQYPPRNRFVCPTPGMRQNPHKKPQLIKKGKGKRKHTVFCPSTTNRSS